MSSTLHVASHENQYVAECLCLGILAARARSKNNEDWELSRIEEVCITLIQELNDSSTDGIGYVTVPLSEFVHQYEAADDNFCRRCRKSQESHVYNLVTDTRWGYP